MESNRRMAQWTMVLATAIFASAGCRQRPEDRAGAILRDVQGWERLFNGKDLDGWRVTPFGGEGAVRVVDACLILEMGAGDLTGVTYQRDVPRMDYEVALEAMRVEGSDFFCGLTVPVGDACITLIVGGWGGSLVGLSSLDDHDASENETARMMDFASGRWYRIRLRVTETRIQAWIDDAPIVGAEPAGRRISVRSEVDLSQPFGIAAWCTKSAVRNIRLRRVTD
jgi:hypothetical protein